jgi:hypothetical protein
MDVMEIGSGLKFSPDDGDSMFLRNVGIYLPVYSASQPRTTFFGLLAKAVQR